VNSANFKYEDGTQSLINANLSIHDRFSDNGAAYGAGSIYCPPQVLRFNSIHTIPRNLTLRGLNPAKKYHFEFYGARAFTSNSKSIFRVGNIADTINTDFNVNDVARLNNVTPDNTGKIVFTLSFIGSFHYVAGFKITESPGSVAGRSNESNSEDHLMESTAMVIESNEALVYPNPFNDQINVNIRELPTGLYLIQITDPAGKVVLQEQQKKLPSGSTSVVQTGFIKPGIYYLQLVGPTYKKSYTIIKM
jgi:hypothetical protein